MNKAFEIALTQYGVKEIVGGNHNPIILNYFKEIGFDWIHDDETAWCSAFVNWCTLKAGMYRSEKLNARSWLTIGEEVLKPKTGDIVVLWRDEPTSWKGHVGFYVSSQDNNIFILGGNQNNMVQIQPYPKSRVLQYRRPILLPK